MSWVVFPQPNFQYKNEKEMNKQEPFFGKETNKLSFGKIIPTHVQTL